MSFFNGDKNYAKVWETKKTEKYIDLVISTSDTDVDGNKNYSKWWPRAIGHAANALKEVKEGDNIVVKKWKISNEPYKNKEGETKRAFRLLIYDADISNFDDSKKSETTKEKTSAAAPDNKNDDGDCPW